MGEGKVSSQGLSGPHRGIVQVAQNRPCSTCIIRLTFVHIVCYILYGQGAQDHSVCPLVQGLVGPQNPAHVYK